MGSVDRAVLWTDALLCLNAVRGFGPATIRRWMARVEDPEAVLTVRGSTLKHCGCPEHEIRMLRAIDPPRFLSEEKERCRREGVTVLAIHEPTYPDLLQHIPDAPPVLYIRGETAALWGVSVAVVGSRRPSVYGLVCARRFGSRLAEAGCTVVSGLAKGIDAAAHKACLDAGGRTVAVLGCGLSHVYPKEHHRLAGRIKEQGCLISEFPMTTLPRPGHFPRRNRIISGLCWGVVVIEALPRSGALVTARWAADQGREVFAVPGRIDEPLSVGPHRLIRDGAMLVTGVEDVMDALHPLVRGGIRGGGFASTAAGEQEEDVGLFRQADGEKRRNARVSPYHEAACGETERFILQRLKSGPVSFDALAVHLRRRTGWHRILLSLEMNRIIERLPGRCYRLSESGAKTRCG